jgi:hypothetical protein
MKIQVSDKNNKIIYELNDSQAAKDLYEQLPLSIKVENFGSIEKIFYPPKKLSTSAPKANANKGTLCYYSAWGNVVMFYGHFGKGASLYELGQAVEGKEKIEALSGAIEVEAVQE